MDPPVLVIGCGVSGLTCAVRLLEAGVPVVVKGRELPPHTTSDVAAAFWYPYRAFPRDRVLGWAERSYRRFAELAGDPATGVALLPALELAGEPIPDPWWGDAVPGWRRARTDELPAGFVDGYRFIAPVIDTRRYLPWLMARVAALGGAIERAEVSGLAAELEHHPRIVNCSGLGARELAGDRELVPIRGELVHIANPGFDTVVVEHDESGGVAYLIPRRGDCVLGGSAEEGREELEPDPRVADAIVARCRRLEPRIAGIRRLGGAVGLRPGRAAVRLEAEHPAPGRLVVHDYGHGGAGVTLSWGCAEEVAELVASPPAGRHS